MWDNQTWGKGVAGAAPRTQSTPGHPDPAPPSPDPLGLDDLDACGYPAWWPTHVGNPPTGGGCGEGECRRCHLEQDWDECIAEEGVTPDGRPAPMVVS